jgi:YihY family inner membrane protein
VQRALRDRVHDLASSIAFYASFGIFPFLLLLVAAASYVLGTEQVQDQLARLIDDALPASGDLIRDSIRAVVRERGRMGLAGGVGLLWSASAAFGAISRAINRVEGTPRPPSFVLARLRYLLIAAIVLTLLVVSVAVASVVELLITTERGWITLPGLENEAAVWVAGWITSFALLFLMFALIYKEAPARPTRWREVWPGALLAATITEIGKIAFLGYIERVANLEAVFGSLTSMMVLLLWLFLAAAALLLGVEYNVVRIEHSSPDRVSGQ